jgi:hypothetical protein
MQADKLHWRWAEMLEKMVILIATFEIALIVVADALDHSSGMWTKW